MSAGQIVHGPAGWVTAQQGTVAGRAGPCHTIDLCHMGRKEHHLAFTDVQDTPAWRSFAGTKVGHD